MRELPKSYIIPNPYNIPVHDQGNKNNCTSHAFALAIEYQLSNKLGEKVIVDVDDLWEKQRKFGTATDAGDRIDGPFIIATKYGVRFDTENGRRGTIFFSDKTVKGNGITHCFINKVEFDK